MTYPMLTWGQWLSSPGFGGTAAVVAAAIAFVGVHRSVGMQRDNARKDQWWDRTKWAVELVVSGNEASANVGLAALAAITEADGFDADELNFLGRVVDLFLLGEESGTLEPRTEPIEEDVDGDHPS